MHIRSHKTRLLLGITVLVAVAISRWTGSPPGSAPRTEPVVAVKAPVRVAAAVRPPPPPQSVTPAATPASTPAIIPPSAPTPVSPKTPRAWAGTEHFSPEMLTLVRRIEAGKPVVVRFGGEERTALLRAADTLTDDFQVSSGLEYDRDRMPASVRVFSGLSGTARAQVTDLLRTAGPDPETEPVPGSGRPEAIVTMAVVNGGYAVAVVEPDGAYTTVRRDPVTGAYSALTIEPHEANLRCGDGGMVDGKRTQCVKSDWVPTEQTWAERGVPVSIEIPDEPEIQAVDATGSNDPSTGVNTRSLEQTPLGLMYEAQLKPAPEIWGVARDYVSTNTTAYLEQQAAYYLAMQAQVAGNYEYQLGTKRMLMELMLLPNVPTSTATWGTGGSGGDKLGQWRSLVDTWRPQWQFQWSTAQGFTSLGGGLAWVGTWHGGWSAGINDNWHWVITTHETGHNAGTGHTSGGVMDPYVGDSHDFFTFLQGNATITAANQIYNHINSRGFNTGILRNPNEMPFAVHDNASTAVNTPLTLDPRANDLVRTPGTGTENNEIRIVEVGNVYPAGAGVASFTPTGVTFTPADGYQGLAWFSYTIRGTVGNNGDGWLHRATIAVTVGSDTRSRTAITIPAGKAVEMRVPAGGYHILTQPAQAVAAYHQLYYTGAHRKYVIYAKPTATGTDSFTYYTGGTPGTVNITYTAPETLTAVEDVVMYDQDSGAVRFTPLGNDRGQGSHISAQDAQVTLVMTNTVTTLADQDYLDNSFSLVSATLIDTDKGTLAVETATWSRDSVATADTTGYLRFTPNPGATGVARIEYTVRDTLGNTDTGDAYVVMPLATINRPVETGSTLNAVHDSTGLWLDSDNHPGADYPLSGTITSAWSLYKGAVNVTYDDAGAADTAAFFDRPGDYTLQLQATDNGFTTTRRALVRVVADSGLPTTPNLGVYPTFTGALVTTAAGTYNLGNLGVTLVDDGKSGGPVTVSWSHRSGPATATFADATVLGTTVTLPATGAYTLRLTMDDGKIKTVRDFNLWRVVDSDGDGLPDEWETGTFGDLSHTASENLDGDAHTVLEEFMSGSNPQTSQHLRFSGAQADTSNNLTLTWDSQQFGPGSTRVFALYEKSSSFTNTGSWTVRKRHLRAAGDTTSVLLPYSAADAELRFFRVAVEGTPVTSTSDILGAKRYSLVVGSNYIGSPFTHDAATVGSVLGTVNLPAGASESAATVVDFWNEATQSMSQRVWLSSAAGFTGWRQTGTFNDATGQAVNLSRGLVITLRSGAGSRTVHLTGRVPTAATSATTLAANGYTLANINYPTAVTLQSLGLPAAGFVGGANYLFSDVVMTYSAAGGAFTGKYWYDSVNSVWRSTAAGSPVANPVFAPGNPILIQRRNRGSSINWTLSRPYTTPFQGP